MSMILHLLFIGEDSLNESGIQPPLLHNRPLTSLSGQLKSVNAVYSGLKSSIYAKLSINQMDPTQLWSAGRDDCGQCCTECTEITYFDQNRIQIRKVCASPIAKTAFFISDQGNVYGVGGDFYGQFGAENENNTNFKEKTLPIRIAELKNVIDVQSARSYSIALCKHHDVSSPVNLSRLIHRWTEQEGVLIPDEISKIMIKYLESTKVFSSKKMPMSSHMFSRPECGWNEMKAFSNKNIITMAVSSTHSLFLDDVGSVWTVWRNVVLERHHFLALKDRIGIDKIAMRESVRLSIPRKMNSFSDIRIKSIACGVAHSLALDEDGRVFSWGRNGFGQCGVRTSESVMTPTVIDMKGKKVDLIRCGYTHSYLRTVRGGHYLFGDNSHGECMASIDRQKVLEPHRINEVLEGKDSITKIVAVFLGYHNTKFLCQMQRM